MWDRPLTDRRGMQGFGQPSFDASNVDETPVRDDALASFIHTRLEAGESPGKIAMYLERVQPGLGRNMLGQIRLGERSLPRPNTLPIGHAAPLSLAVTSSAPEQRSHPRRESEPPPLPDGQQDILRSPFQVEAPVLSGTEAYEVEDSRPSPGLITLAAAGDEKWGPSSIGGAAKNFLSRFHPEGRERVRDVIRHVVGSGFTDEEIRRVEKEIIDNFDLNDKRYFDAVRIDQKTGALMLTPRQSEVVDEMIASFPHDRLGARIRSIYRKKKAENGISRIGATEE